MKAISFFLILSIFNLSAFFQPPKNIIFDVTPTTGLITSESGGFDNFTISLDVEPTADVHIDLLSTNTDEGTITPDYVEFTTSNWDQPQTITVTGVDDDIDDGDVEFTIQTLAAISTDPNYDNVDMLDDVIVTNTDNDTAGITVYPTSGLETTESGGTTQFSVVLDSEPTDSVTIGLSSSTPSEGTVSPDELVFTTSDWDVEQMVTITGINDDVNDGDINYTILLSSATSNDLKYDGKVPDYVSVTNLDNDDPPVAYNDIYPGVEDTLLSVDAPGVLDNDEDINGDTLSAIKVTNPQHGTLTLKTDGSFTYDPDPEFSGTDFFTYKANDGLFDSGITTVTLNISAVNDPPVGNADDYAVDEDQSINQTAPGVLSNDTDPDDTLTAMLISTTEHGDLSFNANGSFTYTPDQNYYGPDQFIYKAYDGKVYSASTTVDITVNSINDAPIASADTYITKATNTSPLQVSAPGVLGNDSDTENDSFTAVKFSDPGFGAVVLNSNGGFTYTPNSGFEGEDQFTYRAYDGEDFSEPVSVTITVDLTPPPKPTWVSPTDSTTEIYHIFDGPIILEVTMDESVTDLQRIEYLIYRPGEDGGWENLGSCFNAPYQLTIQTEDLVINSDGFTTNQIFAIPYDLAGNTIALSTDIRIVISRDPFTKTYLPLIVR